MGYRVDRVCVIIAIIALIIVNLVVAINIIRYPEDAFSIESAYFKRDLTNGDPEAIERYLDLYISRDRYLYNGPLTISLCCEKYNLDYDTVYTEYTNSDYDTFQEFFDAEIKK